MPTILNTETQYLSFQAVAYQYLAFAPDRIIFACSLDLVGATWGESSLPYSNVTLGNVAAVQEAAWGTVANSVGELLGQTVLVYSSTGTYKGKVRLRYITETTITVAANDGIEWADNDLIHILDIFEVWSYPTNVVDLGPGAGLTYYKDTDIAYVDNDTAFPPKANGGVGWAGDVGTVIHQDGSESYAAADGALISSWQWFIRDGAFEEGTVATDEDIALSFFHAGFRWILLIVTDTHNKRSIHRIPMWSFGGNYQPQESFTIKRRMMSVRDSEIVVDAWGTGIDEDTVREGTLVVLFSKTYLDGTLVTADLGAYFQDRRPVQFIGWTLKGSVRYDYEKSMVTFTAGTIGKVADETQGFGTFINDVAAGSVVDWHTGAGLRVRNVIHFLLQWHSNITTLAHIHIQPNELIAGRKFPQAAPFKQIENTLLMNRGVFARLGVTRWSSVHILYDPQEADDAIRNARATVLDLTGDDWVDELEFDRHHKPQVSSVLGGGIYYDGGDGTPYRGRSPGAAGLESGKNLRADRLIITGQVDLNNKLGRLLAAQASQWGTVPLSLAYDIFEPALQEFVTLTATDPIRGYSFTTVDKWIARGVQIEDVTGGAPRVRLEIENLVTGYQGVTVPIPDHDSWTWPPPPPIPEIPVVIPPEAIGTGEAWVIGTTGGGIVYTTDLLSGNPPTWIQLNGGLGDATNIRWGPVGDTMRPSTHLACIDDTGEVYVNINWRGAANWSLALSIAAATNLIVPSEYASISSLDLLQVYAHAGPTDNTAILIVVAEVNVTGVSGSRESWVFYSTNWGSNWNKFAQVTGKYHIDGVSDYLNTQFFAFGYKQITAGPDKSIGMLAFKEESPTGSANILFAARAGFSSLARPNISIGGYSGWNVPAYDRQLCAGANPANEATVGGNGTTPDRYGPGAICVDGNDVVHMSRWLQHECEGSDVLLAYGDYHVMTLDAFGALPNYFACRPHMMAAAFPEDVIDYWILDIDTTTLHTTIYKRDVTNTIPASIAGVDEPCMGIWCYRNKVDGFCILVMGRGYTTTTQASADDENLLWVSVNNGGRWQEKGTSMFDDYGVVGIVGAFGDHSED